MMLTFALLNSLPPFVRDHLAWWVAGFVVLVGLGPYGWRDVRRFSLIRTGAVAGVAFKESLRRRVLWVTPLAMIGILGLSLIIQATDPADAIRQLNKFCYFASGLTAVLTAIVLSCTNLPRDMESKVIFTVVTKPTTRLEIVLGKIAGFSGTAALILGILLVFTAGLITVASTLYQRSIAEELEGGPDVARQTVLEHYQSAGLVASRTMSEAADLQFYGEVPALDPRSRVMVGGVQDAIAPFVFDPLEWTPPDVLDQNQVGPGLGGAYVALKMGWSKPGKEAETAAVPSVSVSFLDQDGYTLIAPQKLPDNHTALSDPQGTEQVFYWLRPDDIAAITDLPPGTPFFVKVQGAGGYRLTLPPDAIQIFVPALRGDDANLIRSDNEHPNATTTIYRPPGPLLRSRPGKKGQQLLSAEEAGQFMAIYRFLDVGDAELVDGRVPIEMKVGVQRSGDTDESVDLTVMAAHFRNRTTGETFGPQLVYPETNQPLFFSAPAGAIKGGSFDLILTNETPGNIIEIRDFSAAVVTAHQPYVFNLLKGFTALWLLSILVITISVFASTFVSWPIAIIVTLCLLLSRWAVDQLSDIMQPGFGQKVAGDFFSNSGGAEVAVTSAAAEALNRVIVAFSSLLPDLGVFDASKWLEAGQSVPWSLLGGSALMVLVFATPLIVVAYIRLRTREMAA